MRPNPLLLSLCLVLFAGPAAQAADPARERLDAFLTGFKTLSAKFSQTVTDETGVELEVSNGDVFLQRPEKFRWQYLAPYEQLIVADGERLWLYEPDLDQVSVRSMDKLLADTPSLLIGGSTSIDDQFTVSDLGQADGLDWVGLTPRNQDSQFSGIRLGFTDTELSVMEMIDNFDQTTRIEFTEQQRDGSIEASKFEFTPPPNVDVLDADQTL